MDDGILHYNEHMGDKQGVINELVRALEGVWAERNNIGLGKPFWTPGRHEQIKALLEKVGNKGENDVAKLIQ